MVTLNPQKIDEYYVFVSSPDDLVDERQEVRRFFELYNRTAARQWGIRFTMVDAETYSTAGVGEPKQLI